MMKVVVFKRLLASGNDQHMAAIYSNGGNRWNILGFNFTKRDALSSVCKISMITSAYTLGTKLHGPNNIRLYPVVN
jgi:hypothetical protein